MRVFAALYHYDDYLRGRLSEFPSAATRTFASLKEWIAADNAPARLGVARELFSDQMVSEGFSTLWNCQELQLAWAKENGFVPTPDGSVIEQILIEQARRFQPDVFWFASWPIRPGFISHLRKTLPAIQHIISWDGTREHLPSLHNGASIVLSSHPESIPFYQSHGIQSAYFPYSFDERILKQLLSNDQVSRAIFTGSVQIAKNGHNERLRLLGELSRMPEFHPYLSITGLNNWRVWAGLIRRLDFDHLVSLYRLFQKNNPPRSGMAMFQLMAESLVTINKHIDVAGDFAGNIRLFEATGVGSCLVTDYKKNLNDWFEIDREVVAYQNADECREKCRWLLENPGKAKDIALAGQRRTLLNYSAKKRAEEFAQILASLNRNS